MGSMIQGLGFRGWSWVFGVRCKNSGCGGAGVAFRTGDRGLRVWTFGVRS